MCFTGTKFPPTIINDSHNEYIHTYLIIVLYLCLAGLDMRTHKHVYLPSTRVDRNDCYLFYYLKALKNFISTESVYITTRWTAQFPCEVKYDRRKWKYIQFTKVFAVYHFLAFLLINGELEKLKHEFHDGVPLWIRQRVSNIFPIKITSHLSRNLLFSLGTLS